MFDDASIERKDDFCMLPIFQAIERQIWKEATIFTDGARWYHDACRWLRLDHQVYGVVPNGRI
jgi:hypothetical protein